MKNYRLIFVLSILMALVFTGCLQDQGTTGSTDDAVYRVSKSGSVDNDPCGIILLPPGDRESISGNRIDQSIIRYQKAVADDPQAISGLERLGWAFVDKARHTRDNGFYVLAEQVALCIAKNHPDSAESYLLRGYVLHNLHRFVEAEKLARNLVTIREQWFDFALLGDVLLERGATDEAIKAYQQMMDIRPGPQAYARVAEIRWILGDVNGALEMIAKTVRSTSPRDREAAAWSRVKMALILMQRQESDQAGIILNEALAIFPDYPPALHAQGRLLLSQKMVSEAIPLLSAAVEADPLPQFRWTLYEAFREAGRLEEARQQTMALRHSGAVEDRRTMSLFLASSEIEPELALDLAFQELELRQDVFTLDAVAWALFQTGQYDQAQNYSERALRYGTQDARLFMHSGLIAAHSGQQKQSQNLLKKAKAQDSMLLPSERDRLVNAFAAL